MTPAGFPHSDISGSKSARDSPELFAACHVLHRLLAPRHPPRALCSLTSLNNSPNGGCQGDISGYITLSFYGRNRRFELDLPIMSFTWKGAIRWYGSRRATEVVRIQRSAGR